jgi:hypothetical protein
MKLEYEKSGLYMFELDSVQSYDIVSIINSVKICDDYCPVHGFC